MLETETSSGQSSSPRLHRPTSDAAFVAKTVRSLLSTMREHLAGGELALLTEVEELALTVRDARAEIAALGADDITASQIPSATDELDAIVVHTATATDSILACCENLDDLSKTLDAEHAEVLQAALTKIYEACSFQDITGQRISKVVTTLKAIELKVAGIMEVFAPNGFPQQSVQKPSIDAPASLLNGPQMPAVAMDQSAIDALLASFD